VSRRPVAAADSTAAAGSAAVAAGAAVGYIQMGDKNLIIINY